MLIQKLYNVLIAPLMLISVLDRVLVFALKILSIIKLLMNVLKNVENLISTINTQGTVKNLMQLLLLNRLLLKVSAPLISQYGIMSVRSVSYVQKTNLITAR